MPDVSLGVILAVASASIFGPLSGWLAVQRRRNVALWGVFGVILGPIAAGLLMSAPPGRCAACRRPVAGWERRCVACGADVQTGLADVPTGVADTPDEDRTAAEPQTQAPVAVQPKRPRAAAAARERTPAAPRARRVEVSATQGPERRRTRSSAASRAAQPPVALETPVAPSPAVLSPADHDWSSRVPATRLGRRPPEVRSAIPAPDAIPVEAETAAVAILGTGVYVGGNRPIQAGDRYLLARGRDELRILGPVHLQPSLVADRVPLGDIEAFVIEGRLIISGRAGSDIAMAFVSVFLEPGVDIVAALGTPVVAASRT